MPVQYKQADLRVRKTNEALINALITLLDTRNFAKISVNELCAAALVSRATFYSHFVDKYELLQYLLLQKLEDLPPNFVIYSKPDVVTTVNDFVMKYRKTIKNIVEDGSDMTAQILQQFFEQFLNKMYGYGEMSQTGTNYGILSKFCVGGALNLTTWQVKSGFRTNNQMINETLCQVIHFILKYAYGEESAQEYES